MNPPHRASGHLFTAQLFWASLDHPNGLLFTGNGKPPKLATQMHSNPATPGFPTPGTREGTAGTALLWRVSRGHLGTKSWHTHRYHVARVTLQPASASWELRVFQKLPEIQPRSPSLLFRREQRQSVDKEGMPLAGSIAQFPVPGQKGERQN